MIRYLFIYLKSTTEDPRATYTVGGTQKHTKLAQYDKVAYNWRAQTAANAFKR